MKTLKVDAGRACPRRRCPTARRLNRPFFLSQNPTESDCSQLSSLLSSSSSLSAAPFLPKYAVMGLLERCDRAYDDEDGREGVGEGREGKEEMRARVWGIAVYTVHDNTVILTVCNGSFMIGHDRRACRKQVGGDIPNIDLNR